MTAAENLAELQLTVAQARQLSRLHAVGAFAYASGASPHDHTASNERVVNVNVCAALQALGLTDSKVVRAGARGAHGQYTAYWLTFEGLKTAFAQRRVTPS